MQNLATYSKDKRSFSYSDVVRITPRELSEPYDLLDVVVVEYRKTKSRSSEATFESYDALRSGYGEMEGLEEYRYGFNGMEKDDEMKGAGNSYDFGARILDPRLGRWLSLDPLADCQPDRSPYKAMNNSPLIFTDPDGRTEYYAVTIDNKITGKKITFEVAISDDLYQGHIQKNCYSKFYDYRSTEVTFTINKDGTMTKSYNSGLVLLDERAEVFATPFAKRIAKHIAYGGVTYRPGGLRMTTESGGSTTTKVIATENVKTITVDLLIDALGGMTNGGSTGRNTKALLERLKNLWDGTSTTVDVVEEIISTIKSNSSNNSKGGGVGSRNIYEHEGRKYQFSQTDSDGQWSVETTPCQGDMGTCYKVIESKDVPKDVIDKQKSQSNSGN